MSTASFGTGGETRIQVIANCILFKTFVTFLLSRLLRPIRFRSAAHGAAVRSVVASLFTRYLYPPPFLIKFNSKPVPATSPRADHFLL